MIQNYIKGRSIYTGFDDEHSRVMRKCPEVPYMIVLVVALETCHDRRIVPLHDQTTDSGPLEGEAAKSRGLNRTVHSLETCRAVSRCDMQPLLMEPP